MRRAAFLLLLLAACSTTAAPNVSAPAPIESPAQDPITPAIIADYQLTWLEQGCVLHVAQASHAVENGAARPFKNAAEAEALAKDYLAQVLPDQGQLLPGSLVFKTAEQTNGLVAVIVYVACSNQAHVPGTGQ